MTEAQRVGQLFVLGLPNDRLTPGVIAAVRADHLGSVSYTAFSDAGVAGIRSVSDSVQALVTASATAGIGFFVAANQEGGRIQALKGPGFSTMPSALVQGTIDPARLRAMAATWGAQLGDAGVNLDFAPVMDVVPAGQEVTNEPIGALRREFGHDPATVASHGVAFLNGMRDAGVATTAKHFPGLGRVVGNTDYRSNVVDSVTTEDDPYLEPFRQAVDAGVPFVMVSLATYERIDPSHLAVFSPTVMRDMLRGSLHFDGVIISDELGAAVAVAGIPPATRAVDFIEAGGDMIVSKFVNPAAAMYRALLARAADSASFRALLDDSVRRVLVAKDRSGLLPCSDR